jgi:geranylgeranyl diphosphate synthase type I
MATTDLGALRARVDTALQGFVAAAVPELTGVGDELAPMAEVAARFVLDGGKRLRPSFCFWAYRAAGGADSDAVVRAASALELVQACALVHDDVIDHSDLRRGMPAAHRRFAGLHRTSDWHGSADDFGAAGAILLGDLFLVWADQMVVTSGLTPATLARAWPVYDVMRIELMAGQFLDVVEQARGGGSLARSLRVARYKSAKYTVERPLHLGAALADAAVGTVAAFSAYGLPLGEAFQLRDDLLGVFGDPSVTGKPAGDDLREGKRTALMALTLEAATPAQVAVVRRHLGDAALDETGVAALRDVVRETGAHRHVEAMITERWEAARGALDAVDLTAEGRAALVALADAATTRAD